MSARFTWTRGGWLLLSVLFIWGLCACPNDSSRSLVVAAYTTPREAFREINANFERHWKEKTGESIEIKESYLSSGAQSRAVLDGFAADVVALALDLDVDRIAQAGLITHPWRSAAYGGIITRSIVAFAVRPGNPRGVQEWQDLLQPNLELLTPNPKTSGGARWNVVAAYGAAKRGHVKGFAATEDGAMDFLQNLLGQVTAMDKGARESILTFERGLGDAALSYENEILEGQRHGKRYELVVPTSTVLIENPVALVDKNIARHNNRDLAEAYLDYLYTTEAQEIFIKHGFRPVSPTLSEKYRGHFKSVQDPFTIQDFGGWQVVQESFFGDKGIFVEASERAHQKRD